MEQNQQKQTTYAHTIPNSDSSVSESFPCNDTNKPGRSKMDMVTYLDGIKKRFYLTNKGFNPQGLFL